MKILVANIGSASFKCRLVDMGGNQQLEAGRVERIVRNGREFADYETANRHCLGQLVGPEGPLRSLDDLVRGRLRRARLARHRARPASQPRGQWDHPSLG